MPVKSEKQSPPQHVYAANLRQNFGYPLRNPRAGNVDKEPYIQGGFQIGDVGYVTDYGEFKLLFNIKFEESLSDSPGFQEPPGIRAFNADRVFMTGVKQGLPGPVEDSRSAVGYRFIATSKAGAILILPSGTTLFELEKEYLDGIKQFVTKNAAEWCRKSGKNSLYLLTAAYKTSSWTLGSFYEGFQDGKIHIDRREDATPVYKWVSEFNVDDQEGPAKNNYPNQTVFIKGFKMTLKPSLLATEQAAEQWFARLLAKLRAKLLSGPSAKIEYFPEYHSELSHPLDIVNHFLLDENPGMKMAVTHDNDWIGMLKDGLPPEHLMEEGLLRSFMVKKCSYGFDRTVYLQRNSEGKGEGGKICESGPSPEYTEEISDDSKSDDDTKPLSEDSRLVITHMRLESFGIEHIDAGVCVLVQFENTTRRTENKPHADIIEWHDEIVLLPDQSAHVTVCGVFQLGSTLGIREISGKRAINTQDPRSTHKIRLRFGDVDGRSSLLITLERHFSQCETHFTHEEKSVFIEKTTLGFDALYTHYRECQPPRSSEREHLETAVGCFQDCLAQCDPKSTHRATACFNLATSELMRCQKNGIYSGLDKVIDLYREALELRGEGHQDRPATLLLLAQALLSRHANGLEYDESAADEIAQLLVEIHHDRSRDRQTADAILAACRFYRAVNAENPDGLLKDLERGAYTPPYGHFDRAHLVHKLGVAFWRRFQSSGSMEDLEKAIELNAEALHFVSEGHEDRDRIVSCLGNALLRAIHVRGQLTDIDMSLGLAELGNKVVSKLGDTTAEGTGGPSEQPREQTEWTDADKLLEQLERMPAAEKLPEQMALLCNAEHLWEQSELASASEKLRKQIEPMSAADRALLAIAKQDSLHAGIPEIQSLLDDWRREDGVPTECKKQLGALLSFLGGEGEIKMRQVLEELNLDWCYKDHKISGTVQALEEHAPYFYNELATELGCLMEGWS